METLASGNQGLSVEPLIFLEWQQIADIEQG